MENSGQTGNDAAAGPAATSLQQEPAAGARGNRRACMLHPPSCGAVLKAAMRPSSLPLTSQERWVGWKATCVTSWQ